MKYYCITHFNQFNCVSALQVSKARTARRTSTTAHATCARTAQPAWTTSIAILARALRPLPANCVNATWTSAACDRTCARTAALVPTPRAVSRAFASTAGLATTVPSTSMTAPWRCASMEPPALTESAPFTASAHPERLVSFVKFRFDQKCEIFIGAC